MIHYGSIAVCSASVGFVDNDVIEIGGIELVDMPSQGFDHSERALRFRLCRTCAVRFVCVSVAKYRFEALSRGVENAHSMREEQDALRFGCKDVKS